MSSISAVINTLNEERNLPFALRSVRSWVDEIIVVDMYSDDRTVEVARKFGAKVFFHERMGFADPARAYALQHASGDWNLILDADEIVPFPLSRRLRQIAASESADAVRIPRLNYLCGSPLMHTCWGPDQDLQLRFFKKGRVRTTGTVHDYLHLVPGNRAVTLKYEAGVAIVHFNYLDCRHFIQKLNPYTSIEANQAFECGKRPSVTGALLRAAREFGVRYVKGKGFLDGWRGFYLSLFMSFYRVAAAAKLQELSTLGPRDKVEAHYQQEAEDLLKAYAEIQSPMAIQR